MWTLPEFMQMNSYLRTLFAHEIPPDIASYRECRSRHSLPNEAIMSEGDVPLTFTWRDILVVTVKRGSYVSDCLRGFSDKLSTPIIFHNNWNIFVVRNHLRHHRPFKNFIYTPEIGPLLGYLRLQCYSMIDEVNLLVFAQAQEWRRQQHIWYQIVRRSSIVHVSSYIYHFRIDFYQPIWKILWRLSRKEPIFTNNCLQS